MKQKPVAYHLINLYILLTDRRRNFQNVVFFTYTIRILLYYVNIGLWYYFGIQDEAVLYKYIVRKKIHNSPYLIVIMVYRSKYSNLIILQVGLNIRTTDLLKQFLRL